jgi:hypothetical protein
MVRYTKSEKELIGGLYTDYTIEELLRLIPGHSAASIVGTARNMGKLKGHRKYEVDHSFFGRPNSLNSYWAGFIAADAYIHKNRRWLSFDLHERDKDHLEKFVSDVGFTGSVRTRIHRDLKRDKVYNQASLNVTVAKHLIADLETRFNITYNKSEDLLSPMLSDELLKCYIVGLIDGDGSIGYNNRSSNDTRVWGLVGTKGILSFIKEKIDLWYPAKRTFKVFPVGPILHKIFVGGVRANEILFDLSEPKVPFLMRKWQKVFDLK